MRKIYTLLISSTGMILCACGTGTSATTATENYGQVVSISQQNLQSFTMNGNSVSYSSPEGLGQLFSTLAYFPNDISQESVAAYNNSSAVSLYNYNPQHNLISDRLNPSFPVESVSAYNIEYMTQNVNTTTSQKVSGLVVVPNMKNGSQIKGVVLYFHPTSFGKNQVPSCLGAPINGYPQISANIPTYCNLATLDGTGASYFLNIAGVFAANGYIVMAPDYLGQGVDTNGLHPYKVYPAQDSLSGLNIIPAMRQILQTKYGISNSQSFGLYITGYSEGGAYALYASKMAQTEAASLLSSNNIQLKISTPYEGSYSLVDQENFALDDNSDGLFNCADNIDLAYQCGESSMMNGNNISTAVSSMNKWRVVSSPAASQLKPAMNAYILSPMMYYGFNNSYDAIYNAMPLAFWQFYMGQDQTNLYNILVNPALTGNDIAGSIIQNAVLNLGYNKIVTPTINTYGSQGQSLYSFPRGQYGVNNAGSLFMSNTITTNPMFQNNFTNAMTYNWSTNSPIHFISLDYDSIVTSINTRQAYSCMKTGNSFAGVPNNMVASSGICSASASSNMVESTIVPNLQVTNNESQLNPITYPNGIAKFWTTQGQNSKFSYTGMAPFDHIEIFYLGNMIALCTFENMRNNGTNSSHCPSGFN